MAEFFLLSDRLSRTRRGRQKTRGYAQPLALRWQHALYVGGTGDGGLREREKEWLTCQCREALAALLRVE
jgi:hypothetical protein